jgi:endonuclease/exonuclease/phosphatase family metal-dependent hydrolase
VLTGDFNANPDSPIFAVLDGKMENTRKIAGNTDNKSTFNGWGKEKGVKIIDYIYVSGFSSCPEYRTVTEKYNDRKFVSDHYPIVSRLIF